jgi:eukaryotic-like serine/threonine-protein kinase
VLCLRDPASGNLLGRVGLGPEAAEMSSLFRIKPDLNAMGDLFAWLTAKGADLLVSDSKTVIARLPTWYRENINAPTFLLLPLMVKGKPIGLIYADKNKAGEIVLAEGDLALLRALRDQAAAAFGKSVA